MPPPNGEILHVKTVDGARIAIKRRPIIGGSPVVLIHGLAVNADLWNLPDVSGRDFRYRSLASVLHEAGCDLWLVNLRGHGAPDMLSEPAPEQNDWSVDHFILYDTPAVLEHVQQETGRRPFVIAASMGAMTLAGYLQGAALDGGKRIVADAELAKRRQAALAGGVFIEFPAALRWPRTIYDADGKLSWPALLRDFWRTDSEVNFPFELLARFGWLQAIIDSLGAVPLDWMRPRPDATAWWAALPRPLADSLAGLQVGALQTLLNAAGTFTGQSNHRAEVFIHGRRYILDHMKAGVLRQLSKCVRVGGFVSDMGEPDHTYSENYNLVCLPTLVVAGGRDRIANPTITREAFFDRISSTDREFRLFESIGHGEFETAPIASEQVYPVIRDWIAARR